VVAIALPTWSPPALAFMLINAPSPKEGSSLVSVLALPLTTLSRITSAHVGAGATHVFGGEKNVSNMIPAPSAKRPSGALAIARLPVTTLPSTVSVPCWL
jgi:hypothetical protein